MRTLGTVLLSVSMLSLSSGFTVHAKDAESAHTEADAAPQPPAAPRADATAKQRQAALERLNKTQWSVELSPMSGERPKRLPTDTLSFTDGKISSERLTKEGFGTSNFTLSVGEDGVPVWETMQTNEQQNTAFWRGELHDEKMSGILSRHNADGTSQDSSFVGQPAGTAPEASAPAPDSAVTPASKKPASSPAATIPLAKKKKGWFR